MRKIKYVLLEDLNKLYGGPLVSAEATGRTATIPTGYPPLPEEVEIKVLNDYDLYQLIRIVPYYAGGFSKTMTVVPFELVREKEVPEAIDIFKPVLEALHPNAWYWTSSWLYIHYPELTITNSLGLSHKIYNLVVKLLVDQKTGSIENLLHGVRFSYTKTELEHGYVHSHLKTYRYNFDSNFCLGASSTPFVQYLSSLRKHSNTVADFELFLIQLKAYLEWESVEGKPYISIRKFLEREEGSGTALQFPPTPSDAIIHFILQRIKQDPSLLCQIAGYFVFDPSLDSDKAYKLQKDILSMFSLEDYSVDYSEARNAYVSNTSRNSYNLPPEIISTNATNNVIKSMFNIVPSIIEEAVVEQEKTVKRLPVDYWNFLVKEVNTQILKNLNKPNAQRIEVSEERESVRNEQITEPDALPAL